MGAAQGGRVPPGALLAGIEANGDPLYVARPKVDGSDSIGKVNPKAHNVCHVPYGGKEQLVRNYQVLVSRPAIQAPRVASGHQDTPEQWVPAPEEVCQQLFMCRGAGTMELQST